MKSLTEIYDALAKPENLIAAISAAGALASAIWAGIAIFQTRAARQLALEDAKARDVNVEGYLNDAYLQATNNKLQAVFDCTYVNKATHPNSIVRAELGLHLISHQASCILLTPSTYVEPELRAITCPTQIMARATVSGILRFSLPDGMQPADVARYDINARFIDDRVCTLSVYLMRRADA